MSEYSARERKIARFWAKVNKNGPYHRKLKSRCWIWNGPLYKGYGMTGSSLTGSQRVHRIAYELVIGPIPQGLVLDHLCRNRACCNPSHLEAVTSKENILRGQGHTAQNARKTHCKYGHALVESNIYRRPHRPLNRECRKCRIAFGKTRPDCAKSPLMSDQEQPTGGEK